MNDFGSLVVDVGTAFISGFEALYRLVILLLIMSVVTLPLAIWKVIDIIIWMAN
jgi:hypothetical protein